MFDRNRTVLTHMVKTHFINTLDMQQILVIGGIAYQLIARSEAGRELGVSH